MVNVLVAVDFCDHSPLTLEVAFALARGARGRVTVIHVVHLPQLPEPPREEADGRAELERYARESANECLDGLLRRTGLDERVDRILRVGGAPATVIGEEAVSLGADMIVVGSHDRSLLSRMVQGSIGQRVQRKAHCPVVTVRSGMFETLTRGARSVPRRAAFHGGTLE